MKYSIGVNGKIICEGEMSIASIIFLASEGRPEPGDCEFDEDAVMRDSVCPNCNREYDEVNHEYQICHICKFNNNL